MHPFDFIRADSSAPVMPIIIFVIWLVISLVAGAQKRKKRQQQAAARQQSSRSADPLAELKRELATVLSEKSRSAEEEQPLEVRQAETDGLPESSETLETAEGYDRQGVEYNTYEETEPEAEAAAPAKQPAAPAVPVFQVAAPQKAVYTEIKSAEEEFEPALSLTSVDDARTGFLWSEVLGPPKALREE